MLDLDDVDADAYLDVTPGSQEDDAEPASQRERLLRMARRADVVELHLPNLAALREAMGGQARMLVRFELPVADGVTYLSRTHPAVEGLAAYVMDAALDPLLDGRARRCGAIRTAAVATRTTLLLLRLRHHVVTVRQRWGKPAAGRGMHRRRLPRRAGQCLLALRNGGRDAAEPPSRQATSCRNRRPISCARWWTGSGISARTSTRSQSNGRRSCWRRTAACGWRAGNQRLRYEVRPQLPVDVLGIYRAAAGGRLMVFGPSGCDGFLQQVLRPGVQALALGFGQRGCTSMDGPDRCAA